MVVGWSYCICGDSEVLLSPPRVSLRAAVTSRGRGCVSLAVVQIAIRSPCLASGQGCLLTVPQSIAEVDDKACRPRVERNEQRRGWRVSRGEGSREAGRAAPAEQTSPHCLHLAFLHLEEQRDSSNRASRGDPLESLTPGKPLSRGNSLVGGSWEGHQSLSFIY